MHLFHIVCDFLVVLFFGLNWFSNTRRIAKLESYCDWLAEDLMALENDVYEGEFEVEFADAQKDELAP